MRVTTRMTGMSAMTAKMRSFQRNFPDFVAQALRLEAEIEMTEAKRRTPWDTGALRASGHVQSVKREGRSLSVALTFGGAAAGYAIYVHENLEAHHPHGQAKFLESVLNESSPHMASRLARRMQLTGRQELVQ